ncbi:MAG: hypothetical protein GTO41_26460, partial [Burkholderiales bacterium]|nr:hypothetical protein [Burkholderiales bacterium]
MTGINLSLGRLFKIWWAIQWRGALVSLVFCAVCYSMWQAFPWPVLLATWAPNVSINAIAVLAAALIGIPFGLLTVRWFLYASFSDLQILMESQESRDPPRFRIEPRIGNVEHASFQTKPIALNRAVNAANQAQTQTCPASPKVQKPKAQVDHRSGYARS